MCNADIADVMLTGLSNDILSFDFAKAFYKVLHSNVLNTVAKVGMSNKILA